VVKATPTPSRYRCLLQFRGYGNRYTWANRIARAIEIGRRALLDRDWAVETTARLAHASLRLDDLALDRGFRLVGGAPLFRLYDTGDAIAAQAHLAGARIWSRIFSGRAGWLRLGLPGEETEWTRLATALRGS